MILLVIESMVLLLVGVETFLDRRIIRHKRVVLVDVPTSLVGGRRFSSRYRLAPSMTRRSELMSTATARAACCALDPTGVSLPHPSFGKLR